MDIDKSKENIQPLRGGRNMQQLSLALTAMADPVSRDTLILHQQTYEEEIKNYNGPDPLDPWFNYIQWIEQSFPKHGHEGQIEKILKTCLSRFENDERYKQDRRYLKLWIKYIDYLKNPLHMYQSLYNWGVGTTCSELYRAWANYCEEVSDYKKADMIYNYGIQANAQPLDELTEAHITFQTWVAQRIANDDSPTKRKAASALVETRNALTSLKSVKRRNVATVPSERIGENIRSYPPGVVRQGGSLNQPKSNMMVDIYEDKPGTSSAVDIQRTAEGSSLPVPTSLLLSCDSKENEKEVGIWSNPSAKNGKLGTSAKTVNSLPFEFYEDDRIILSSKHQPFCSDDFSTFIVPICAPDPPDDTKISMYNKKEVYKDLGNGEIKEFSLEEIRARKYLSSFIQKKQIIASTNNAPYISKNELPEINKLECNLPKSENPSQSNNPGYEYGDIQDIGNNMEYNLENVIKQSNSILNADSPSEMLPETNNIYNMGYNACKSQGYENTEKCENAYGGVNNDENNFDNPKKNILDDFNRSLMSNINSSMTVHTKEVAKEMNLFHGNAGDVSIKPTLITPQNPMKFEIHEDTSMTIAARKGFGNVPSNYGQYHEKQDPEKIPNFDETCSTQAFNFNIPDSTSTPFTNNFKKPCFIDKTKISSIKKLNMEADCEYPKKQGENMPQYVKGNESGVCGPPESQCGDGLSTIMETTREHRSGSSSSGSYQTTRNTLGYTARESCGPSLGVIIEKSQQELDSEINMSSYQQPNDANYYSKQQANFNQNRAIPNVTPKLATEKIQMPYNTQQAQPSYTTTDNQYLKTNSNYNGYNIQRTPTQGYHTPQPNNVNTNLYQNQPNYQRPNQNLTGYQNTYQQQNVAYHNQNYPPTQHTMPTTPNTPGNVQTPHVDYHQPNGQQHIQSPYHNYQNQHNYNNHSTSYTNSQQMYQGYPGQQNMSTIQQNYQQAYQNQSPHNSYQNQVNHSGFQMPSSSTQDYNNPHVNYQSPHSYHSTQNANHQAYQQQNVYQNRSYPDVSQNYSANAQYQSQNNSYHSPKPQVYPAQFNYQSQLQQQSPQVHQYQQHQQMHLSNHQITKPQINSPSHQQLQQPYANYKNTHSNSFAMPQNSYVNANSYTPNQMMHNQSINTSISNNQQMNNLSDKSYNNVHTPIQSQSFNVNPKSYQSPTSKLRSVRHEVPHVNNKLNYNSPNPDFSNQYLNFISNRNEPKDNANTPKFGSSPNISQKMHKNLYVSSPEQGQVPPNTESNYNEPIKSNYTSTILDKQKDVPKRQLDFENRLEFACEDSRESFEKDGRLSSMSSKNSIGSKTTIRTDNHMDVDSENSMDCQNITFKSNCSNSHISTQDLPMPADIEFPKPIDPFNSKLCDELLNYVKFPNKNHYENCYEVVNVPKLQQNTTITLGSSKYSIEKQLGKGSFGSVFRALELSRGRNVALKYQKPRHPWEFYICQEIKARIKEDVLRGYMDVDVAFIGANATIFVSELSKYGSLLDVANKVRTSTNKCIHELIVMLLASEMLSIVHYLHKAEIIHADIKPDNFLIMEPPQMDTTGLYPCLQLIDFGCAIDMSLLPKGVTFTKVIQTSGFTCTEMREGRPWTYQTDLYCLAGTVHAVLMGNYMQIAHRGGKWNVEKKWPRYLKTAVWEKMFTTLLNVEDCTNFPDLLSLKDVLDDTLHAEKGQLNNQLRLFSNVLKSR